MTQQAMMTKKEAFEVPEVESRFSGCLMLPFNFSNRVILKSGPHSSKPENKIRVNREAIKEFHVDAGFGVS
jgi:hypothetical protein